MKKIIITILILVIAFTATYLLTQKKDKTTQKTIQSDAQYIPNTQSEGL